MNDDAPAKKPTPMTSAARTTALTRPEGWSEEVHPPPASTCPSYLLRKPAGRPTPPAEQQVEPAPGCRFDGTFPLRREKTATAANLPFPTRTPPRRRPGHRLGSKESIEPGRQRRGEEATGAGARATGRKERMMARCVWPPRLLPRPRPRIARGRLLKS